MAEKTEPRREDFEWFSVHLTHPSHNDKKIFESTSEKRARAFIERRFPRGTEAYLKTPDGTCWHFEQERQGEWGSEVELWQEFNPAEYTLPDAVMAPGQAAWADKEV